ncbi:MAG: hypothetical protein QOF76_212 [Solirubrobacteraceae bacterium]|jgi:cytochrome P450|nr:hypothetical protein [Solirubrobacteraceae bacterium]
MAVVAEPRFDQRRFPPASRRPKLLQTVDGMRDPLGTFGALRDAYGPVFTARIFPFKAGLVCAADPATNQEVLTDTERFVGGDAAILLEPIVGTGSLILTPPPRHLRNRKLLLPPFHGERMKGWTAAVETIFAHGVDELPVGAPTPIRPWAQRLTLDVILRVIFGIEDPVRMATFRTALDRLTEIRMQGLLFGPAALRRDFGRRSPGGILAGRRAAVDALLIEEIERRRAAPEGDDILGILLAARDEDGRGYSDTELRDELKGLVLAGHETTATAIAWTVHLLAHNPAVRDRAAAGDVEYLRAVIRESMRLRAPVFDAVRIATRDTTLGGQPVPAGAFVSAMFCITHLDPAVWDEPHAFRPERHLEGKPVPYAYTPFGGGVRRCIGAALAQLELEVGLRLLSERLVPEPAGPPERCILQGVTLVPAKGGRVVFRRQVAS